MEKKKKLKKLIVILIIIVAVIIVAIFAARKLTGVTSESGTMLVQLQEVEKKDLSDTISVSGTVTGENKKNYTSNVESKFLTVEVEVGDEVKKGDVIATLDQETIKKQISSLEKSISNSNALQQNQSQMNQQALADAKEEQTSQLADAQKVVDTAKAQMNQAKTYYDSIANSEEQEEVLFAKQEYESAKAAYQEAVDTYNDIKKATDASIKSAQNTIDMEKYTTDDNTEAQEQLTELRKQLEECTIVCEEDGIVTSVNVYEGAYNTPGATIATVENNQSMILTASVEETDILKLEEGMEAIVTAKALGDQELKGEVVKVVKIAGGSSSMDGMSDYAGSSVSGYSVQIKIEPSELISGMSAKAKIFLSQKENVLCVPYDIVMEDENGENYILVAVETEDGMYTAEKRTVTLGEEVDYYIEVTDGDVAEGDLVILDLSIMEGDIFEGMFSMDYIESEIIDY